jgi:pseudouridylate synthase
MSASVRLTPDVAAALRAGRPIVALESSVLAQGLPVPANQEAARRMVEAVRARRATPAITAVVRGVPTAGLLDDELARFLKRNGIRKLSARDMPLAMASGVDGATTVAASLTIAAAAGVTVFATGGIGGVHREPPYDESADLTELARAPMVVVCAGAKSILDLEATVERLETLGVPLLGYRTGELPGFLTVGTGIPLPARVETAAEVAAVYQAQRALGRQQAVLVVQSPPAALALSRAEMDAAVSAALEGARRGGVRGGAVTPYLLAEVERTTGGRSLGANLALLECNAALAAEIAGLLSEHGSRPAT